MLLLSLLSSPLEFIIFVAVILLCLTVHEYAHAWTANKLGDSTAKSMGRLTLNPLAHLDLFGTIFLLLAGFGWGKPVMVNTRSFENPKVDNLTVSLAGPMSNFILAVLFGLIIRFLPLPVLLTNILTLVVFLNLTLMTFNLLPIPPLDGSKVLALFLSEETEMAIQQIGIYLLLFLLIFSANVPVLGFILTRVVGFFFHFITGSTAPL